LELKWCTYGPQLINSHKIHHGPILEKVINFFLIIHSVVDDKDYIEMTKKIKDFKTRMNKCMVYIYIYIYMKAFGEATPDSAPVYFWGCKWSNPWLQPPEPSSIQPDGHFIHPGHKRTVEPDSTSNVTESKGTEPPTGKEEEEEAMAAMGKRNNTANSLLLLQQQNKKTTDASSSFFSQFLELRLIVSNFFIIF